MNPVNVLFIWHFHQPYYMDDLTGEILMPWVGLHGTKDYYFMGAVLEKFPDIHATFNYSPSLLKQLEYYSENFDKVIKNETFLSISDKKISDLSFSDKLFIVEKFFSACSGSNYFLEKSARFKSLYRQLKNARLNGNIAEDEIDSIFGGQEYLDIIVNFYLIWIDPVSINSDDFLKGLRLKDKNFSEQDKNKLLREKIPSLIKRIIPFTMELFKKGQISLSSSPFYHPILPLLCDTNIASLHGEKKLPEIFRHPDDADHQIKSSINYFRDKLGCEINGMWPSEGSVSEKTLSLFIDNGIKWIATDEGILENSIGVSLSDPKNRGLIYKPYIAKRNGKNLLLFFRDRGFSDLIGFKYSNHDPKDAANDLINNFKNIAITYQKYNNNGLLTIPIILDGENAWEFYKNNGYEFFNYLYEGLSENKDIINTLTVEEYIKKLEKTLNLSLNDSNLNNFSDINNIKTLKDEYLRDSELFNIPAIFPGSWINKNFKIWIGSEEDNKSWDLLSKTRNFLAGISSQSGNSDFKYSKEALISAWEQIYIAEGSDFNWWYGEDRTSGIDEEYDCLYRTHLANVYKFLDESPPDDYNIPIIVEKRVVKPTFDMVSLINPCINGSIDNYFEWLGSAVYYPSDLTGKAMAYSYRHIKKILFGFSEENLFLRFDFNKKGAIELKDKILKIEFIEPLKEVIEVKFSRDIYSGLSASSQIFDAKGDKIMSGDVMAVFKDVLEISVPIKALNLKPSLNVSFFSILTFTNNPLVELERFPVNGYFQSVVPDDNFKRSNWIV